MPDTDHDEPDFAALARDLRASVLAPDFATLHRRARRRRAQRMVGGAAVVAVVAAVLAGLVLLSPGHDRPAVRPAAPVEGAAGWQTTGVALTAEGGDGIAVQEGCDSGGVSCRFRTLSTSDLGAHWTVDQPLPDDATEFTPTGLTPVLVKQTLAVLVDSSGQPVLSSADEGRSWRRLRAGSIEHAVAQVDSGFRWFITVRMPFFGESGSAPEHNDVLAYDVVTGTAGPLLHQPPIDRVTDATRTDTGTIWAAGLDAAGHPLVATSPDGAHWTLHPLGRTTMDQVRIADVHGARAALIGSRVDSSRGGPEVPLAALWTSDDSGASFVPVPRGRSWPTSLEGLRVLSDGTLVVTGASTDGAVSISPSPGASSQLFRAQGTALRSTDGGRSFSVLPVPSILVSVDRVDGGDTLFGLGVEPGRIVLYRGADGGARWQPTTLP